MTAKIHAARPLEPLDLFGQAVAAAPFAVWIADHEGRLLAMNETMRLLMRLEDPRAVFDGYDLFSDPGAIAQGLVSELRRALGGQIIRMVVAVDPGPEARGKEQYLSCLYAPLTDGQGRFAHLAAVIEDATRAQIEDLSDARLAHAQDAKDEKLTREMEEEANLLRRIGMLKARLASLEPV